MKQASILVVDDDPAVREVYSEMLRTQGYKVWEAATGELSLEVTRQQRPDLVLLDVVLPDLSGVEVCRQIKADPGLADVFVVLFSGTAISATDKIGGLETGADEYLTKGISREEFLARIRTISRLRDTTAALRASQARKSAIMQAALDGIITIDEEGKIVEFNAAAEKMFGRTRAGVLGKEIAMVIVPPSLREEHRNGMAHFLWRGEGQALGKRIETTACAQMGAIFRRN